ncbi:unnamed protein product [Linum trigynum]|uniref:RNase H type-1 domain-containing protein n=1 Tax=Linum trigynum TaxID=586398 RepID=A0AAV2G9N5_9ROSI
MISEISPFHILQCVCLPWRIWKFRNKVTFEFYQPHVRSLARHFYNQVFQVSNPLPLDRCFIILIKPLGSLHDDYLKINFDAVVRDSGCSSGLVIHGSDGHVVLAADMHHMGVVNPFLPELLTISDAITIVVSRSLTHVIVEGDFEVVVNQFRQSVIEDSFGGPVLRECHQLLDSLLVCIDFREVPRAANSAAHRVAPKALLRVF